MTNLKRTKKAMIRAIRGVKLKKELSKIDGFGRNFGQTGQSERKARVWAFFEDNDDV